jgi:hypothetical protein
VWSTNEERHALFTARAWSSALLAAQRSTGDAAATETDNQRIRHARHKEAQRHKNQRNPFVLFALFCG